MEYMYVYRCVCIYVCTVWLTSLRVIRSAGCLAVSVVTIKRWYYFNVCDLVRNKEDGLFGN